MAFASKNSSCCERFPDLAVVPMGGEGLDERTFASFEHICDHSAKLWWLSISRCTLCGQNWMVAAEERIYDDYFLRRVSVTETNEAIEHRWPNDFLTYESVLKVGSTLSNPCMFMDPRDKCLARTVAELRNERADITPEEIALLFGIPPKSAKRLFI
jgi:hypothetical protein